MEISPIKDTLRIALVGDYSPDIVAHRAIPLAIDDAAAVLELVADYDWLTTSDINSSEDLIGCHAIWVVPGSPYRHLEGALIAIRYARENSIPFTGPAAAFSMRFWSTPATCWAGEMPPTPRRTPRVGW